MDLQPFSAGADAWVVTETQSAFYDRLNWLSNFSLSKSFNHQPMQQSQKVSDILSNCSLEKSAKLFND